MKTIYGMFLLMATLLLGATNAAAQNDFRIGLEFGAGPSNYHISAGDYAETKPKPVPGISAGLYIRTPFSRNMGMTISPKYKMTGYREYGSTDNLVFHNIALDLNAYYLIPILSNFAISPTCGWFLNYWPGTSNDMVEPLNTGPNFGICFDVVSSFQFGIDYQIGILDLYKKEFRVEGVKTNSRVLSCYVRFLFGG